MDPRGVVLVVDPDEQTRAAARVVAERTGNDVVAVDDATALIEQLTEPPGWPSSRSTWPAN